MSDYLNAPRFNKGESVIKMAEEYEEGVQEIMPFMPETIDDSFSKLE